MNAAREASDLFKLIDAMWRIEFVGDASLAQLWRAARNKAARLRQVEVDLARLEAYMRAHGSQAKSDQKKPRKAPRLRSPR